MKSLITKTTVRHLCAFVLCMAGAIPATAMATNQQWQAPVINYLRFESIIYQSAKRHNVDIALINALIHTESYFNPKATSIKGAGGLMQLMPQTALRYGVTELYNPKQNVDAGVRYLKDLLVRYENDVLLALAAYNAGEEAVDKYNGIPPYNETQEYVKKVLKKREVFKGWP